MRKVDRLLTRLLEWAVYGMVVMALVFNFTIVIQTLFAPLSVVEGNSMKPYIEDSDAVLSLGVAPQDLKPGDVVIFPDPEDAESSIVHRIISLEERDGELFLTTKGDSNPQADPFLVPARRVYGKVRMVIPMGGAFLAFLRSPSGFALCVVSPFLVLALFLVGQRYKEKQGRGNGLLLRELIKA